MLELLDSRASFELAAWVVTWVAVTFLTLIAVNLHVRLQRLERLGSATSPKRPYGRFVGRSIGELSVDTAAGTTPRLLLFLSNDCPACGRLLDELARGDRPEPTALLWTDGVPEPKPRLPPNVTMLDTGRQIGTELGITVTPFALVIDDDGRIAEAGPISRLPRTEPSLGGSVSPPILQPIGN